MPYENKKMDMTVVIFSLDGDVYKIKKSITSTGELCGNYDILISSISKIQNIGYETIQFENNSISDLIDTSMKKIKTKWAYFLQAGSVVCKGVDKKLSRHISSEKDVLYPVYNRIWDFVDSSINGLLLSKSLYEEVGEFKEEIDPKFTKLMWAGKALEKGCRFKAVVGTRNI